MKLFYLVLILVYSIPAFSVEKVFNCITLNSDFRPDGGSFSVNVNNPQPITNIKGKGNQFLKGFEAEAPGSLIPCKNADQICGFSHTLESKAGPWIEMSSHINLGKDTSSITRPSGFFYKIKTLVMKDSAEKELLESETKDNKIGHVYLVEPATGLDKAKRKVALRIQCGT